MKLNYTFVVRKHLQRSKKIKSFNIYSRSHVIMLIGFHFAKCGTGIVKFKILKDFHAKIKQHIKFQLSHSHQMKLTLTLI